MAILLQSVFLQSFGKIDAAILEPWSGPSRKGFHGRREDGPQ